MSITSEEATAVLQTVTHAVQPHTELVVVASQVAEDRLRVEAVGSGLLLDTQLGTVLVTCEHVVNKGEVRYFGPNRLAQPRIPDKHTPGSVAPSQLLNTNPPADLALLRGAVAKGKSPYPLDRSSDITADFLEGQKGTASFLLGLWGDKLRAHAYPDGLFYMEAPLYSSIGPLVEVSTHQLVADMAEKEILFINEKSFSQLRGEAATGGVRDLGGISGSGLWMLDGQTPILVGVVLGRNPSASDEHLIRVAPVWVLCDWIASLCEDG